MKRITSLFFFILLMLTACQKSVGIFDDTASKRLQIATDNFRQLLLSSDRGWQMIYFKETLPIFSDMYRNIKGSDPYGFTFIQKYYGYGGRYFLIKFSDNGTLQMQSDTNGNIQNSDYTITQNTYLQLNFVSPNYIFDTGQSSFLFLRENTDGSLVFTTGKYADGNKEYIVLRKISEENSWDDTIQKIQNSRNAFERRWNSDRNATLKVTDSYGNQVFASTSFSSQPNKYIDTDRRYVTFVKNMEPHTSKSSYYTALGSGYIALEEEILFLPGFNVDNKAVFTQFRLEEGKYVSRQNGYTAIIE